MAFIIGTPASQTINGTTLFDFIFGDLGNDTLNGGNGGDILSGGFGNDRLTVGSGPARLLGGAGADTAVLAAGPWSVSLPSESNLSILVNLATGQRVSLRDIETLVLGSQTIVFRSGTDTANAIAGTAQADFIKGADGNDTIQAGAGNDTVSSGTGADKVATGDGNDVIDERVSINGLQSLPQAANSFDLGKGDDTAAITLNASLNGFVRELTERFTIVGGIGRDIVNVSNLSTATYHFEDNKLVATPLGAASEPQLFATFSGVEQVLDVQGDRVFNLKNGQFVEGRTTIAATAAQPSPTGTALSEELVGNAGANMLTGGGGLDHFIGGGGIDAAILGGRPEQLGLASTFGALITTVNGRLGIRLNNNNDVQNPGSFVANDIERLRFLAGPGASDDVLFNLRIIADTKTTGTQTAGNDFAVFDGGLAAATSLDMLAGNDFVFGRGQIAGLAGGEGNDKIEWEVGGGATMLTGGLGDDSVTVRFFGSGSRPQVSLDLGAGNDTGSLVGILLDATVNAGAGDDVLNIGTTSTVAAGTGNDLIVLNTFVPFALSSPSTIDGGAGIDAVDVPDSIFNIRFSEGTKGELFLTSVSNDGTATISNVEGFLFRELALTAAALTGGQMVTGGDKDDLFAGGAAGDVLAGEGGVDKLNGAGGNDILTGGAGNDSIQGGLGNDALGGGDGNDNLQGQAGNDIIDGGLGNDTMSGQTGFDQFRFNHANRSFGLDMVLGFQAGSGLGDVLAFDGGDQRYDTFGEILAASVQAGKNTVITLKGNFESDPDARITLVGVTKSKLVADDFDFFASF